MINKTQVKEKKIIFDQKKKILKVLYSISCIGDIYIDKSLREITTEIINFQYQFEFEMKLNIGEWI